MEEVWEKCSDLLLICGRLSPIRSISWSIVIGMACTNAIHRIFRPESYCNMNYGNRAVEETSKHFFLVNRLSCSLKGLLKPPIGAGLTCPTTAPFMVCFFSHTKMIIANGTRSYLPSLQVERLTFLKRFKIQMCALTRSERDNHFSLTTIQCMKGSL